MDEPGGITWIKSMRGSSFLISLGIGIVLTGIFIAAALAVSGWQNRSALQASSLVLRGQTETYLRQMTDQYAQEYDLTLEQIRASLEQLAVYAAAVYDGSLQADAAEGWQFQDLMTEGNEGQYSNGADDLTSVFVPAFQTIDAAVERDIALGAYLEAPMQAFYESSDLLSAVFFVTAHEVTRYYPNVQLGTVILPDYQATGQDWYLRASAAIDTQAGALWGSVYKDPVSSDLVVTASAPVSTQAGRLVGVVGCDVSLQDITADAELARAMGSGYIFIIDQTGQSIGLPVRGYLDMLGRAPGTYEISTDLSQLSTEFSGVISEMLAGKDGFQQVERQGDVFYVTYAALPDTGWSLGLVVRETDALAAINKLGARVENANRQLVWDYILPAAAGLFVVAVLTGWLLSRRWTVPLHKLTEATQGVMDERMEAELPAIRQDEFRRVGQAVVLLAEQLKGQQVNAASLLETQTQDLRRRNELLEAASAVIRETVVLRDLDQLLEQAVQSISKRFGYYHASIFLIDEAKEYALMRAASSEGGRRMVARGHRQKLSDVGIIGYVAQRGKPRIAYDRGDEAAFFRSPDLSHSRSEMALALKSQEKVIGVLDLQSSEETAFRPEDIDIIQAVADQIALAVDNSRLIHALRQASEELKRTVTHQTQEAWNERLRTRQIGYAFSALGVVPAAQELPGGRYETLQAQITQQEDGSYLSVPICMRDQLVGMISLRRETGERGWSEDELRLVTQAVAQIGPALENARLLEEAQSRALREQTVNVIATQVRTSAGIQSILQNAVRELGKALGASRTFIQFGVEPGSAPPVEDKSVE